MPPHAGTNSMNLPVMPAFACGHWWLHEGSCLGHAAAALWKHTLTEKFSFLENHPTATMVTWIQITRLQQWSLGSSSLELSLHHRSLTWQLISLTWQ